MSSSAIVQRCAETVGPPLHQPFRGIAQCIAAVLPKRKPALHRAGQPMGERLLRVLQRQIARRMSRPGSLLRPERSSCRDRAMGRSRQHDTSAPIARLSAASQPPSSRQSASGLRFSELMTETGEFKAAGRRCPSPAWPFSTTEFGAIAFSSEACPRSCSGDG